MKKLLNLSLKRFMIYAGLVLAISIPVYYISISMLWQYELDEHNIILTPEAGREDKFLIIGAVTLLTVLFFVLLLVGFIILNRNISKKLWQPFYSSLYQIKDFDLTQQNTPVFEKTNIEEFVQLNDGLGKLISGNIAVFKQQKEFADNASHELQTPLAIVQSKLEILLQGPSLTEEQYNTIDETLSALARVGRINKNLLLLAKIENSQYTESQSINLSDLLEHTSASLMNFAETRQIQLRKDIRPGIIIKGNKILAEILLNNLLSNAIRYSNNNGSISVNLSANNLSISNTGTTPLKQDQLFKRFARATSQSPGTGLGLALVQQICRRYNWHIDYNFENDQHHFAVRF